MTPTRAYLLVLFPPSVWAAMEVFFAVAVVVLSFVQKANDHDFSMKSCYGIFNYVALVTKASLGFLCIHDGILAGALKEGPRPLATLLLAVMAMQQVRVLLHHYFLMRLLTDKPPAPLIIIQPDADIVHSRQARLAQGGPFR